MAIPRKQIRQIVVDVLEACEIDRPPVEVEQIASHLDVRVIQGKGANELSGFLHPATESNKAVIGVNQGHPLVRQRFTIAHELGHFLLHGTQRFHVDEFLQEGLQIYRRDARSSGGSEKFEIEANFFAAELLMPTSFMADDLEDDDWIDLSTDDDIAGLAKRYLVSPQSMTFRLSNLGYISL